MLSAGSKVTTRAASKTGSEDVPAPSLQSLDDKLNSILNILDRNSTDISDIKSEQKDICASIEFCNSGINEIKARLGEHSKQIENCEEDIKVIKEENVNLSRELVNVKNKFNDLEQYSHRNNLIVYGIPEDKSENIMGVLRRLAVSLMFPDWSDSLVDMVHRMGRPSGDSPRPIIIKFVRRLDRNEFLNKRKVRRNLRASDLGYSSDNPVYVNESLTPANRELLKLTREAARRKSYSQVWTANCAIYVRKERGKAPAVKISSIEDVNNL